jgi:hypothetical protein
LVGDCEEEDARGVDAHGLEDFVAGNVAPDPGEAVACEPAVDGMVDLDDHKRNSGAVEHARGGLPLRP